MSSFNLIEYYDNCSTYYGPLPSACLLTIWTEAGCIEEGTENPAMILQSDMKLTYEDKNQRQVLALLCIFSILICYLF